MFTPHGDLAVANVADDSTLATYRIDADGSLTSLGSAHDGFAAACWIRAAGGYYYVANLGSGNVSAFTIAANGEVRLVAPNPILTPKSGVSNMAVSGRYLYAQQPVAGTVTGYRVNADASLTQVTMVNGRNAFDYATGGMEGLATD